MKRIMKRLSIMMAATVLLFIATGIVIVLFWLSVALMPEATDTLGRIMDTLAKGSALAGLLTILAFWLVS